MENNLNALAAFVEVARLGGFNKAAVALAMQPSTLSRRIAALEADMGVRLFLRTTRSVHLTREGQALYDEIAPRIAEVCDAAHRVQRVRSAMEGVVRIATSSTLADICLAPVLSTLSQAHPGIQVELDLDSEIVDLHARRLDFAIRAGVLRAPGQVARKIGMHRFCLYHAPGAETARPLTYDQAELPVDTPLCAAKDFHLLRRLVLAGQGVARMPDAFCAGEEEAGRLIRDTGAGDPRFDVFVAYPERVALSRRARVVMDMVIDEAAVQMRRCDRLAGARKS